MRLSGGSERRSPGKTKARSGGAREGGDGQRPSDDALTLVFGQAHVASLLSGRVVLTAPWGWRRRGSDHAAFYLVLDGGGVLEGDGVPARAIGRGDFVFLAPGRGHVLRDRPRARVTLDDAALERGLARGAVRLGGGGAPTTLLTGCCAFDGIMARRFTQALPPLVHVAGEAGAAAAELAPLFALLAEESAAGRPGAPLITARLVDILLLRALRLHHQGGRCPSHGWLGALTDATFGRALALIHQRPEAPWTVASLARAVGQSRSAFAAGFAAAVGEPPLSYLTSWRMELAARLLREERLAVAEVAARVGYGAEAAFARSFKRWSGTPPGRYRVAGAPTP